MAKPNLTIIIGNPIMKFLLRSRWHGAASDNVLLLTVTGRKTGKEYTTPVNYVENEEEGILTILTHRHRTWWRNLRGNAPVTVYLRGESVTGIGYAYEEGSQLADSFYTYMCATPNLARHFGVELDDDGQPIRASSDAAAAGKVMVEIWLDGDYEEIPPEEAATAP